MLKSLYGKLIFGFLLVAFTTAALVAVFIRLTSADRLMEFIIDQQRTRLEQTLSDYYASHGSWDEVAQDWTQIQSQSQPTPAVTFSNRSFRNNRPPPEGQTGRNFFGLANLRGTVIVSVDPNYPAGSQLPMDLLKDGTPVTVDGQQVGTILTTRQPPGLNPQEALFLQRTNEALIFASLGALLVAVIMGILLARTLSGPLQALTQAAQSITQGQLEQQVKVSSNDEIGQLASAFNMMSQEVARVNQLRRQMTADIAHDLRTPLTVISGYIESMRDGDLKPTPERLALIYSEIERLQDLVGDLRTLSLADAGELTLYKQPLSPKNLLEKAASVFQHQAEQQGVEIQVKADTSLPDIQVDEARMMQILGNLISNALRYTPSKGIITLSAEASDNLVEICVRDTGEGIAVEDLPNIFNRFHRADKSRHSESGETGLGLAIVRALVELHGGNTFAESVEGQGTSIQISFPTNHKTV